MKIVFIGSGNVATHLAKAFYAAHHSIAQIYSRNLKHALQLAQKVDAEAIHALEALCTDADFYIFCIKDDALTALIRQMPKINGIWLHTAGSIPMNIFDGYTESYGVCYPLQTFSINREVSIKDIPFFIEGNNPYIAEKTANLVKTLASKVYFLSSEKRLYLHLAGIFACNFVNHLYDISETILHAEGIHFQVLHPLIRETAEKVQTLSPHEAQTGPAIRNDLSVMNKHCKLLNNVNHEAIYRTLSKSIYLYYINKKKPKKR